MREPVREVAEYNSSEEGFMSVYHIGKIINNFKILDFKRVRQPKGYYYQYYLVKCPHCQSQKWMMRGTIENPVVVSCGCKRREYLRKSADVVKGKTFGKLIALHPTGEGGNYGKELWLCSCTCGNTIKVTPNQLNWGWVKNCGCPRSKSGHKYISRKNNKWQASPVIDGRKTYLGVFENIEDAIAACEAQERVDTSMSSANTSGYTGVSKDKNKWIAYIGYQKKRIYLGRFDCIEDAVAARKEAEKIYGVRNGRD